MADLKITELAALAGADLAAGDQLAIADSSASETKRITVTDLVGNATTLIADATIPGAKILFGSQQIAGTALANGAVDTTQLANDAVTGAKLADESTVDLVTTLPASGAFVGQIALDTGDNKIYCWNGSVWVSIKASGSANSFVGSSSGIVNIDITISGDEVTIATSLDNTTAAAQFLAGPTGSAGAPTYRAIAGTDLPLASASQRGGIQVSGDGLRMDTGKIEIDNDVTATSGSYKIVDVNAKGLVVNYKDIEAVDLPVATDLTVGAVSPGSDLEVSAAGVLNHEEKVAGGGTFTKVTVNATGHVTAGTNLAEADIPSLNASKIGAGTLPTARIADDAITGAKVGDYAVSKFGEVQPTADHIGQFFFNPLTRGLFLWDGNVFQPVGISAGEIVLAGTYDASTNLLDSVTAEGSAAGFTNGQSLPSAGAGNNRYYVVVSQTGTGTAPAPTVTLEPPDILLSNGSSYVLIETSETITAQVASNVGFTPYGNLASTNVQGAIAELDDEKVALSGDTMTGDLTLSTGVNLVYEGATDNEFETTLTVTDPTADNTVTIPDETGTVVTTGSSGVVTSTMITDGTIVNADISSSAEIAVSKLADGSARQLLQTDAVGTGVEWASNIDIPGTLDVSGATVLDSNLNVDSGTFYVDATNNSVGVRTNAPGAHLHIGDAGATIRLGQTTGTAYTEIYRDSTSGFTVYDAAQADPSRAHVFQLGGTDALRINSDGNVGIGTSSPDELLHIQGDTAEFKGTNTNPIADTGGTEQVFKLGIEGQKNSLYGPAGSIIFRQDDSTWSSVNANYKPTRIEFCTQDGTTSDTSETPRLVIDQNGNVGIGTTSPSDLLDLSATEPYLRIGSSASQTGNNIGGIRFATTDPSYVTGGFPAYINAQDFSTNGSAFGLVFGTQNADRVVINNLGYIGIGTTSPGSVLHLAADGNCAATIQAGTDSSASNLTFGDTSSNTAGQISYLHASDAMTFRTGGSGEDMRIDSAGRLLVGTSTSLQAKYAGSSFQPGFQNAAVSGTGGFFRYANINDGAALVFNKSRNATVGGHTIVNNNETLGYLGFTGSDGTQFQTAASITAVTDGTPGANDMPGRLVFSTTADGSDTPTERMRLSSNGNLYEYSDQDQLLLRNSNAAGTTRQFISGRYSATGTTSGGTLSFVVYTNGNVENTNNSYTAISDIKLKENIVDANSQWDDLKALQVRNYNLKEGQTHTQIGLVAQEVELVSPGLVSESPDRDEEGNDLGTVTKSVNYSVLYMKAVKALQEAMERIETLEQRLTDAGL